MVLKSQTVRAKTSWATVGPAKDKHQALTQLEVFFSSDYL